MTTEFQFSTKKPCCSECGQTISPRKESLSKGIIRTLYKVASHIKSTGINKVHPDKDLSLSSSEYNNFQKLRYHGLVAKCKTKAGERLSGYWLVTHKGYNFLNNEMGTHKYVEVFNNRVVGYSDSVLTMSEIVGNPDTEHFPKVDTIEWRT